MIGIELSGGLGNQLFEYAFIYDQHKKLNTRFFLIKVGAPILLYKYFKVERNLFYLIDKLAFDHDGYKLFFSHYLRRFFYNQVRHFKLDKDVTIDNTDDPEKALLRAANGVLYHGYFQSEIYFRDNAASLKSVLKIKSKYTKAYQQKYSWLSKYQNVVVVHIRLTDYKTAFNYLNLGNHDLGIPISYYHKLIAEIDNKNNFYVFISDEIEVAKQEFQYLENKYFSEEQEIIDFQLMQNADTCIVANSSFSWWAAYLNNKTNKKVYCPKHYLGFYVNADYPTKIYPDNWIKVPVM